MSLEDLSFEQRDELAALAKRLADNPATRKDFLRMTKKVNPDLVIPELALEESTQKMMDQAEDRVKQLENKLMQKEAEEKLDRKRQALIESGKASSRQEVEEIEKVMIEKHIADHDAAADYWKWMQQSAEPTPMGYNPSAMNKFDLSKYWKNPQLGARDEAAKALQELRGNRRPIGI